MQYNGNSYKMDMEMDIISESYSSALEQPDITPQTETDVWNIATLPVRPKFQGYEKFKLIDTDKSQLSHTESLLKPMTSSTEKPVSKPIDKLTFAGSTTDSSKNMVILETSVIKAKQLHGDIVQCPQLSPEGTPFLGFSPPSKKTISELFINSQNLLQDFDQFVPVEEKTFNGLSIAKNNPISLSEQALINSNNLLSDNKIQKLCKEPVLSEFNTINIQLISVSEHVEVDNNTLFTELDIPFHSSENVFNRTELQQCKKQEISTGSLYGFRTISTKPSVSQKNIVNNNVCDIDTKVLTKPILTKQALIDSKLLLSETPFDIQDACNKMELQECEKQIYRPQSFEFSVGSNKLSASKQTFFNGKELSDIDPKESVLTKPAFTGFSTASNKPISVSEQALIDSKHLLSELETPFDTQVAKPQEKSKEDQIFSKPSLSRSSTASTKPISISKQAVSDSNSSFKDLFNIKAPDWCKPSVSGFSTASNKPISVSEQALIDSKLLLSELETPFETQDVLNNKGLQKCKDEQHLFKASFSGFSTASNKPISISEQALIDSKKILSQLDTKEPVLCKPGFLEFSTASNKPIYIADQTLIDSKQIISDPDLKEPVLSKAGFSGFTTANNKPISVSEHALIDSKKVLTEIDTKEPVFSRFSTASNKLITISEEALIYSKHLLSQSETPFDIHIPKPQDVLKRTEQTIFVKPAVFGFNNTTYKPNSLSKQALIDSKKILCKLDTFEEEEFIKLSQSPLKKSSKQFLDLQGSQPDSILDTQVAIDFEQTLCTEDFHNYISPVKRPTSPILPCTIKKRKSFKLPPPAKPPIPTTATFKHTPTKYFFDENYKQDKPIKIKDISFNCNTNRDSFLFKYEYDELLNVEFEGKRNNISDGKITVADLMDIFRYSVDGKIISHGWLENHIRLILWKLISYEKKFGKDMDLVCSAREVLHQLKYRYDRELNKVIRPILRKVYERDDTSARTMVLAVVKIINNNSVQNPSSKLELTDGWYCIHADLDPMLSRMVRSKKIVVGTKLMTTAAQLLHCELGLEPWEEAAKNVRLKIFGNSTRRVRWHTRLGCHGYMTMPVTLSSVQEDGGLISELRAVVTKVFPVRYIERQEDGSTVSRSELEEQVYQQQYETQWQNRLQAVLDEVTEKYQQMTQDEEEVAPGCKRKQWESGSQIVKAMKHAFDSQEFRGSLTESQQRLVYKYEERRCEQIRREVERRMLELPARNVVLLVRIRIAHGSRTASLAIWTPRPCNVREGKTISVKYAMPTGSRNNELQLSAGRRSIIRELPSKLDSLRKDITINLNRTNKPTLDYYNRPRPYIQISPDVSPPLSLE